MQDKKSTQERRLLQAANFFCRNVGIKTVGISHVSEKLAGLRRLTAKDLDAISVIVPDDHILQAYWEDVLAGLPHRGDRGSVTCIARPDLPVFSTPTRPIKKEGA